MLSKHREERDHLKSMKTKLTSLKQEVARKKDELSSKKKSTESIQNRFVFKVRDTLIESNAEKFLINVGKGEKVENWRAIQEDARKLQKMCGGRVLPEEELILKITELHGDDENQDIEAATGKTRVRNPYRKLWEEWRVTWPRVQPKSQRDNLPTESTTFGISPCSFTSSSHSKKHCINDEFLKEQEQFMINMALKESMKASGSESETPVARSEKKVTFEDPTGQHSAENSTTGLDVLADIAINGNF